MERPYLYVSKKVKTALTRWTGVFRPKITWFRYKKTTVISRYKKFLDRQE